MVLAAVAAVLAIDSIVYAVSVVVFTVLTATGATTLVWMLHAWRDPTALERTRFAVDRVRSPCHSFSLIVPARHEELVLERTLSRMAAIDHPDFEILVVVGDDDAGTRTVAEHVARRHPDVIRVLTDSSWPKNKPRALNTALPECRGDIIGVFDAEDVVATRLLSRVDHAFQVADIDVVQGATQLMNHHSSWYSARNVLEYYFWFKSRLHFQAEQGFIPLGGNTLFVRADRLRAVGGWDPDCLAEDCDLGARLSIAGARTIVIYDSSLATQEETPTSLRALARQRTRWNQGYLQVLLKGGWRRLPAKPRALALYTLGFPFVQAFTGVLMLAAIPGIVLLSLPTWMAMYSFLPLFPMATICAVELVGLREFGREYAVHIRVLDYLRVIVGTVPYQAILAAAALRAVAREVMGVRTWEKTAHAGAHL